jgi:transposase
VWYNPALIGEIMVPRHAAHRLGVSETRIRLMVANGRVTGYRLSYRPGTGRPDMLGVDVHEVAAKLRVRPQ